MSEVRTIVIVIMLVGLSLAVARLDHRTLFRFYRSLNNLDVHVLGKKWTLLKALPTKEGNSLLAYVAVRIRGAQGFFG